MDEVKVKKYVTLERLATFKVMGDRRWASKDGLAEEVRSALGEMLTEATEEDIMGIFTKEG